MRAQRKGKVYAGQRSGLSDASAPEEKRRSVENRAIVRAFFSVMNLDYLYGYVPNMTEDGACVPFEPEGEEEEGEGTRAEAERQTFSKVWNGYYTQRGDRLSGRLLRAAGGGLRP